MTVAVVANLAQWSSEFYEGASRRAEKVGWSPNQEYASVAAAGGLD